MDLTPYVENLRRELTAAAEAAGADPLTGPVESAIRLTLLDALSAAADEITRELAPGSAELRLRSGEPELVVSAPPPEEPIEVDAPPLVPADVEDGAMTRINLRLPEQLKGAVEQAAARERMSVNAWLVRAAGAALANDGGDRSPPARGGRVGQTYTGWVR